MVSFVTVISLADQLTIIGLTMDAVGAALLGAVLIRSRRKIKKRSTKGGMKLGVYVDKDLEDAYRFEKKVGVLGVTLLVLGFAFQVAGRLVV